MSLVLALVQRQAQCRTHRLRRPLARVRSLLREFNARSIRRLIARRIDLSVQSFQDLLKDMATLTRNSVRFESSATEFHQLTESTTLQRRALELLSTHAYPDTAFSFQGFMTPFH